MPSISRAQRLLYEEIAFQFCGEIRKHFAKALEIHPHFKGVECIASEFADVVKAVESESGQEIRKQCVHLAVVALREYIANWSKGEPMKPDST